MMEMVGIRQVMWFVVLESAKDRVIRVDTQGQQVPPRVWYGMTCLIIRGVVGSVPCSDEWEFDVVTRPSSHDVRGAVVLHTTLVKLGIRPIVNLCNGM
jgi:hypothetical protein